MVWLKRFDGDVSGGEHLANGFLTSIGVRESYLGVVEREQNRSGILLRNRVAKSLVLPRQRPSNVIEGVPQVANDIADDQAPLVSNVGVDLDGVDKGSFHGHTCDCCRQLYFALLLDGDLRHQGRGEAPAQRLNVNVCPLKLEVGAAKRMIWRV